MTTTHSTARHNVMRFDIRLDHVYPMILADEIDMPDLIRKVRAAIVDTVNAETQWHPDASVVNATGGDGSRCDGGPLHDEEITWDFS